jgi:uncharacterized protein (DUF433 family)
MHIPHELSDVLVSTDDTLHGAVRFAGTRVFAKSLFDYVMGGHSLEEFLEHFPDVTREQAMRLLDWEYSRLSLEFGWSA